VKESRPDTAVPTAGVLRRIAAMFYDSLLLVAVLMLAALPVVLIAHGVPAGTVPHLLYQLYLLAIMFLFHTWFWIHGGQTVGMRAWRLQVQAQNGGAVTWRMAGLRFLAAIPTLLCAGLGLWWVWIDREHLAWHDRLSGTRVVVLPKPDRP
jgi:uncharacterized RDD family membrane protein YckC